MMQISDDFYIRCEKCGNLIQVSADDLEYDTQVYDRAMGEEIEYDFLGEVCCENCQSWINFTIRGYEYPVGAFEYSDSECHGGSFVDVPSVGMDYVFDLDYYDEAYAQYHRVESSIERNREKIKRMTPREFEVFVAEVFEDYGFSVKITKETRDGGKDIIATKADPIPYTLLIECKHWSDHHRVGVDVVRAVYGVQRADEANQSVVVTSSRFTRDAQEFAKGRKHSMELVDIDDLLKLIEKNEHMAD